MKKTAIKTENDYEVAIAQLNVFLKKGFTNLTTKETKELESISQAVADYEKEYYPVPKPETIAEMIELKMYELKLTQKKLAERLKITPDKLSQILNGKREPDVTFLKAAYLDLNIDPGFLLRNV
jgi:antitoxin component HigA of HigAB toxin-antitoxin module